MDKKRVLVLADSPTSPTGFANVCLHILKDLYATDLYDITLLGINYDGQPHNFPYKIIPATSGLNPRYNDLLGRQRCIDELRDGNYDIFFAIQDMSVIMTMAKALKELRDKKPDLKTIMYIPVDSDLGTQPEWVNTVFPVIDYPVVYTEYAKKEVLKFTQRTDVLVCYHGIEPTEFFPCKSDLKRDLVLNDYFLLKEPFKSEAEVDKRFIIINVNRNQIRKDYLRTFQIFAEFKRKYPQSRPLLIIVAQIVDQGGNLDIIAAQCGLQYGIDWVTPIGYNAANGYKVEVINLWYNCADAVLSTTLGEGFGLSSIEGMACGVPVVFPGHTSLVEILGEGDRGWLVPAGALLGDYITSGIYDSSLVRPRVSITYAVEALAGILDRDSPAVHEKRDAALAWISTMHWSKVNKFWVDLFSKVSGNVSEAA
jgi:D-inositol-3-phosphate glycosyltransferase